MMPRQAVRLGLGVLFRVCVLSALACDERVVAAGIEIDLARCENVDCAGPAPVTAQAEIEIGSCTPELGPELAVRWTLIDSSLPCGEERCRLINFGLDRADLPLRPHVHRAHRRQRPRAVPNLSGVRASRTRRRLGLSMVNDRLDSSSPPQLPPARSPARALAAVPSPPKSPARPAYPCAAALRPARRAACGAGAATRSLARGTRG